MSQPQQAPYATADLDLTAADADQTSADQASVVPELDRRPEPLIEAEPPVQRIAHLIIRVNDQSYDRLYELLAQVLQLPVAWRPAEHAPLRSCGLFAGNVAIELLHTGQIVGMIGPRAGRAHFYGIAFELREAGTAPFVERGLRHVAVAHARAEPGRSQTMPAWLSVLLPDLLGSNLWMKLFFTLGWRLPSGTWANAGTSEAASSSMGTPFLLRRVYRDGAVLAMKYNPAWRDVEEERRASQAQLEERAGGPLGLVGVREVVVGAANLAAARRHWTRLLAPLPGTGDVWRLPDGPAIRLVQHERHGLVAMVWQVRSLARAKTFLAERRWLGQGGDGDVRIDPASLLGLDVRLVER